MLKFPRSSTGENFNIRFLNHHIKLYFNMTPIFFILLIISVYSYVNKHDKMSTVILGGGITSDFYLVFFNAFLNFPNFLQ